ncbi:MAG: GTP pyrophosphokinase family protein [Lachnospiraceae bacterium]|nr:GTP pyrophosphokinase family protein [Lachnospiraceae bacterium]
MQKFDQLMMMYNCAIREIRTKLEVLNDDLGARYERNPIEHINARIKSPESIAKKLKSKNLPICSDSIPNNLNDVAGIRVICSFIDDIYTIAGMLIRQDDVRLVKMKDYIEHPKPNGYRSLHLILEVPVFFADVTRPMRVEVQIRTIAMDFWASLDHHLRYKKDVKDAQEIENELRRCADVISQTDEDMLKIRKRIFSDEAARSENHSFW